MERWAWKSRCCFAGSLHVQFYGAVEKVSSLKLLFVTLAEFEHDAIAVHTVRVCAKLLQVFSELEEVEQLDMINQLVDVYQEVKFRASRHSFHAIRSAGVLTAEILFRICSH